MRCPPAPANSSRASRSAQGRTASASGLSRVGTRLATPATCASRVAAAAVVIAALAGCTGHGHLRSAQVRRGQAVFAQSCPNCHTLIGRDSNAPGGDLAIAKLTAADVRSFIRVMPVRLSATDAEAVAAYVNA